MSLSLSGIRWTQQVQKKSIGMFFKKHFGKFSSTLPPSDLNIKDTLDPTSSEEEHQEVKTKRQSESSAQSFPHSDDQTKTLDPTSSEEEH